MFLRGIVAINFLSCKIQDLLFVISEVLKKITAIVSGAQSAIDIQKRARAQVIS